MHHSHRPDVQLLFAVFEFTYFTNCIQEAWWSKSNWICQQVFPWTIVDFVKFCYILKCVQFKVLEMRQKWSWFCSNVHNLNVILSENNLWPWINRPSYFPINVSSNATKPPMNMWWIRTLHIQYTHLLLMHINMSSRST